MATGTGKTITSLLAARSFISKSKSSITVIVVPFQHLVDQWERDIKFILDSPTIKCMGARTSWNKKLKTMIQEHNLNLLDDFVIVTTYKTVLSKEFTDLIKMIIAPKMIIADECHYITYNGFKDFPFYSFDAKLGLSATPDRWWDEEGTTFMKSKLGRVVYEYTLEQAIQHKKLTPYKYFPHIVDFEEIEMEVYMNLTRRIIYFMNNKDRDKDQLETLLRRRAMLISKAENKIETFLNDFKNENLKQISHTLVYCAPGEIDKIVKKISDLGVKVSKFNAEVNNKDRMAILEMFEKGYIQVLVAIKCLDEGVDVPATRKAYFLASTSNPREFVQRRGRILRTSHSKKFAEIHDYIVLPTGMDSDEFYSIASKEFPRFSEFNESALNSVDNKLDMHNILENYDMTHLMYKKPWEVYKEMKENFENVNVE